MFKCEFSVGRLPALVLAAALLGACSKSNTPSTANQGTKNWQQPTTPKVVEKPESGVILEDDASASAGRDVPTEEGPLHRIHFAYDKSDVNVESQSILSGNASYLKQNPATFIRVEGHADDRGSVEYNQALGERRANSAKQYLMALGIDANRLDTTSWGEDRPLSFEHSEYGWALNRRAEFRILSE